MDVGEIPDSDLDIPILNGKKPVWTKLGLVRPDKESAGLSDVDETTANSKQSIELVDLRSISSNSTHDIGEKAISIHSVQHNQVMDQHAALPAQSLTAIQIEHSPGSPLLELDSRRRRRFDFKKYVDEDRRTHEYVYKKKFINFRGALSDSEDDDFSIPTAENNPEDHNNTIEGQSDSEEESSSSEPSDQGYESLKDQSLPRPEKRARKTNSTIIRRHKHVIESDSEIGSEPDTDSDTESETPFVDRRLKQVIPASVTNNADQSSLGKYSQDGSSLEETFESQYSQSYSFLSVPAFFGEATESRGSGIDTMAARPARPKPKPKQMSIVALAQRVGPKASQALKIAARTAIRRMTTKPGAMHQASLFSETSKVFSNRNSLAQNLFSRTKKAQPIVSEKMSTKPLHKYFANQSADTMQVLKRWSRGSLQYDHLIPIEPPYTRYKIKRSSRKPSNKRYKPQQISYRTPIIEKRLEGQKDSGERYFNPSASFFEVERTHSEVSTESKIRKIFVPTLHSKLRSPCRHVNAKNFSKSTFIGSNLLDIAHSTYNCNELVLTSNFGTSVRTANKARVSADIQQLANISNSLNQQLFEDIYRYFLDATLFLCDEISIVDIGFKQFVVQEWLRLARSVLKHSLKNKMKNKLQVQLTQLIILSALLASERTGVLDLRKQKKAKLLVIWVVFYYQDFTSAEVDSQPQGDKCKSVAVELLIAAHKFKVWDLLPEFFEKIESVEPYWHLLVLVTCSGNWVNWSLARSLADKTLYSDTYTTMLYIHQLLTIWKWDYSPEIIIDLFNYLAKLKNYADPKGETISLPKYLISSNFDGRNIPKQSFALFLELLGFTLRNVKRDQVTCRKLASRVTPLSALTFPETKEVRPADLSRASHQYGILIVLRRVLDDIIRPDIAQFRDLVVLNTAHWAIRLKALSAWSLVCHIVTSESDFHKCRLWMEEILDGKFREVTVNAACKEALEVFNPLAVPVRRLIDLGLQSTAEATRKLAWKLFSLAELDNKDTLSLCRVQPHFTASDKQAIVMILGTKDLHLVHAWCKSNADFAVETYTYLLESRLLVVPKSLREISRVIIEILFGEHLATPGISLLRASGLITSKTEADYRHRFPSNIERASLIRNVLPKLELDEATCRFALEKTSQLMAQFKSFPDKTVLFEILVSELRRFVLAIYPELLSEFRIQGNEANRSLETVHANLLNFTRQQNHSFQNVFYFFAYRLRNLITPDAQKPRDIKDSQFITEILNSFQAMDALLEERIMVRFLSMAGFLFEEAQQVLFRTQKNSVHLILPTLVKCTRLLLNWKRPYSRETGNLVAEICRYLHAKVSRDPATIRSAFTQELCGALGDLGVKWVSQIDLSESPAVIEDTSRLVSSIHILISELLKALETSDVTSLSALPRPRQTQNEFGESLIATFQISNFLNDDQAGTTKSKGFQKLKYFESYLETLERIF